MENINMGKNLPNKRNNRNKVAVDVRQLCERVQKALSRSSFFSETALRLPTI